MREKSLKSLIALTLVPGLGNRKILALLNTLKDPSRVFEVSKSTLRSVPGIGEASTLSILSFKDWDRVDQIFKHASNTGVRLLGIHDEEYPTSLKQIFNPPVLLWCLGEVNLLNKKGISVIGTRNPSAYGRRWAEIITRELIQQDLVIISGLAYGIDTIAHRTTVEQAGETIAVLGSGIDVIYPWRNKSLVNKMLDLGGLIISEFPPGTKPDAGNFPVRNRIVSGLSMGVVVIESGIQGGSLITAELALDQNKEVFAIPHPIDSVAGNGCNYLIKTGQAKLIQHSGDILDELPLEVKESESIQKIQKSYETDNALYRSILDHLQLRNMHIDEISDHLHLDTNLLLVSLLELEMMGWVRQRAGKVFELS